MRTTPRRRLAITAAVATCVVLAVLTVIGLVGLTLPPRDPATIALDDDSIDVDGAPRVDSPRPVILTADAEQSARRVAGALFHWDTRHGTPADWAQPLVNIAEGEDASVVAADVRGYLPTPDQWATLRQFGTRQWLRIEAAVVPARWSVAVAQAAPGQLPPGATAFTVTGIRHRDGVWEDQPIRTERQVSFTVFLACDRIEPCRLLRLSRVDAPLE